MGKGLKAKMGKARIQVASDSNPTHTAISKTGTFWSILRLKWKSVLASSTRISFSLLASFRDSSPQVVVASNSHTTTPLPIISTKAPGIPPNWPGSGHLSIPKQTVVNEYKSVD